MNTKEFERFEVDQNTLQGIADLESHNLTRLVEGYRDRQGLVASAMTTTKEYVKQRQAYEIAAGNLRRLNAKAGAKFLKQFHAWKKAKTQH